MISRKTSSLCLVLCTFFMSFSVVQDTLADTKGYKPKGKSIQALAEEGNVKAQAKLGSMYERGSGVPQSYEAAAYWYDAAARQGYPEAQYSLGRLYAMGKGVSQNYFNSYLWLNLAASKEASEKNVRARDQAARNMRPREIAAAQAMSLACLESDYVQCSRPRGIRDIFRN